MNENIESYIAKVMKFLEMALFNRHEELRDDVAKEWNERGLAYNQNYQNKVNSLVEEVLTWGEYNDIEGYILVLLSLLRLNNYIRQGDKGEEFMRIFKDTRKDIFDNLQGGAVYDVNTVINVTTNMTVFIEDFLRDNYNIPGANISNQIYIMNKNLDNYIAKVIQLLEMVWFDKWSELKEAIIAEWSESFYHNSNHYNFLRKETIIRKWKETYHRYNYKVDVNILILYIIATRGQYTSREGYNALEGYLLLILRLLQLNGHIKQDDNDQELMQIFEDTKKYIDDDLVERVANGGVAEAAIDIALNFSRFIEDFLEDRYNIDGANIITQLLINKWLAENTKDIK